MSQQLPFTPYPFLSNPHLQTILGRFPFGAAPPPSTAVAVTLDDGDTLVGALSTPVAWRDGDRTVVLLHGLAGSESSAYMARIGRRLWKRGFRVLRLNFRGAGPGKGKAVRPYNAGCSTDVRMVLEQLLEKTPASPITLVGFSLGGNVALKLAAEWGDEAGLDQVIAICPAVDLARSVELIGQRANKIYDRYFVKSLVKEVEEQDGPLPLPRSATLYQFDDIYTAPRGGYVDADDYYRNASSKPLIGDIAITTQILFAADDPFVDSTSLSDVMLPSHVTVYHTEQGGHLGFLASPSHHGEVRWLDQTIERWIFDKGDHDAAS